LSRRSRIIEPLTVAYFTPRENIRIFYLPPVIKFANSEFIYAINGLKLGRENEEIQHSCSIE